MTIFGPVPAYSNSIVRPCSKCGTQMHLARRPINRITTNGRSSARSARTSKASLSAQRYCLRNNSGSWAKLTASRRASSLVSYWPPCVASLLVRRPEPPRIKIAQPLSVLSRTIKQASFISAIVQGGGKRRSGMAD